jgi:iron(III) transport system substrate-binding protein
MAGNANEFYEGSSSLAKDVTLGEIAVGPAIDYYGRTQVALGGSEKGVPRLGFVMPASLTVITPDPIAILKGAPNGETAKMFVDFVMSPEGQRLWMLKAGTPGGPKKSDLMRMAILPSVYDGDRSLWSVDANPYTFKGSFAFDAEKAAARREVMLDLMKCTLIQPQSSLRECWKAVRAAGSPEALVDRMARPPIDEAECMRLSGAEWEKQDVRAAKTTEWVKFAIGKYNEIAAEAAK